jgi:hypothetical protein
MLAGGQAAAASQGSVPAEVAAYAADPAGLLAAVDDVAGVGGNGQGIAFDDTAKVGQLNRVFVFTPAFLTGEETETPIERVNEWSAPIELGGKPLGLATIWINPASVAPELGAFEVGATIGAALTDVPADAFLVRDASHGAWFTLVGEDLAPVVAGTSGFDAPTTLADYQEFLLEEEAVVPETPQSIAPVLASMVIVVSVLVIAAVLLMPVLRERRRSRADAAAESPTPALPVPSKELVVEPVTSKVVVAAKPPAKPATKSPAKPSPAKPSVAASSAKQPAAKPATKAVPAKPKASTPSTARPAVVKAAAAKSAAARPAAAKPAAASGAKPAASRKPKTALPE